jgi:spermidine synthase
VTSATRDDPELLAMESPWQCQPGVIRVPRRHGESAAETLAPRVDRDGLKRPYIFETRYERRLHFTQDSTQSAMSRLDPYLLVAPYTRKMMAFLLLNPDPHHIVMLGLGGGSLAKFCYRHLPRTRITVVEIDSDVVALRDEFLIPRDDARFRVIHDDGASYVERNDEPIDALLVDAFDADGIASSLGSPGFYASAARRLTERGVFVMNLWGNTERFTTNVQHAVGAFGANAVLISVLGELNLLLFASRRAPPKAITEEYEMIAARLQQALQLDFPRYLRRICQGETLRDR